MPGVGISHYLKTYQQENSNQVSYITDEDTLPVLKRQNIVNMDLLKNPESYRFVDKLFLTSLPDQKFVVLVDDPSWLRSQFATQSSFVERIYQTEFFPVHSFEDAKAMALEINPKLTSSQLDKITSESAGLAKLIKCLSLDSQSNINTLLSSTIQVINRCTDDELEKFGIKKSGQFTSPLISKLIKSTHTNLSINIFVSPDMSITENDQSFGKKVSVIESQIISEIIKNGQITKEKIAEIKWGTNSYDSFSDQAIKKTMMRLSVKLKKYRIKSLTKVGYQLTIR